MSAEDTITAALSRGISPRGAARANGSDYATSAELAVEQSLCDEGKLKPNATNAPNARKLIRSLRHLGYDNVAAIEDLADNGFDAGASSIHIGVHKSKASGDFTITVSDDGSGMDQETLDQALRLGSETERNAMSDLGLYGMGAVTASLSIGKRVEFITKTKGGPLLYSRQDVDEIADANEFVKFIGPAPEEAAHLFAALLGGAAESGTVVRITKCDHIQNKDVTSFTGRLQREMGRTYRWFLKSGRKLWLNGAEVKAVDPLMEDEGAQIQSDETYPIKFTDEYSVEHTDSIRVRLALLPDFGMDGNRERGINLRNQGFYLLRNYREVAAGEMFDLIPKHNHLNRVRAELYFNGSMDTAFGSDFTKQNPKPHQSVLDKLRETVIPQMRALENRVKTQVVKVQDEGVPHDEAARLIGKKAHLLAKPKLPVEERAPKTKNGFRNGTGEGEGTREPRQTKEKEVALPARFETVSMTAAGPIWNAEPENGGKTLLIQWNRDHAFYQRFVLENRDNISMVTASDFLVYSLAAAELFYNDDDARSMLENIRGIVSNNMRQLLS